MQQTPPTARPIVSPAHTLLAGVAIKAPLVDGLCGTVYAMKATIDALIRKLPAERKSQPTVAILGGGGYIAKRLVGVLAMGKRATAKHGTAESDPLLGAPAVALDILPESDVNRPARQPTAPHHIIALDTRYADKRHIAANVVYTADPAYLKSADVVMVLTRTGDDVEEYVEHSQPGQVRLILGVTWPKPSVTFLRQYCYCLKRKVRQRKSKLVTLLRRPALERGIQHSQLVLPCLPCSVATCCLHGSTSRLT